MAEFTAKDVKALRDATGAGMMDAKKALVENDGDFEAAAKWLREKGLGKAAERSDRESAQGAVAIGQTSDAAAIVELKCETDFVAASEQFVKLVQELADAVAAGGEDAVGARQDAVDDLKITLKENIQLGTVQRVERSGDQVLDTYLHRQGGRGVNAVVVVLEGGTQELAHDVAVHIAFGRPRYLTRDEVPEAEIAAEREALEAQTRNEGKPEAALPKIVEGKLGGWFKRVPGGVLLDQPFTKDEKQTVSQALGSASVVRFAQAVVGG